MHKTNLFPVLLLLLALAPQAQAYVGPGLGVGVLGAIAGVVLAVLLALVGMVWYPLKGMIRRRKEASIAQRKPE
jgi:hypothetical protein